VTLLPGMNSLAAPSKNKNDPLQGSDDYAALSESNRRALKTLLDQYYASIENSLKVLVINVIRTVYYYYYFVVVVIIITIIKLILFYYT
jgi:hypothetical protein